MTLIGSNQQRKSSQFIGTSLFRALYKLTLIQDFLLRCSSKLIITFLTITMITRFIVSDSWAISESKLPLTGAPLM